MSRCEGVITIKKVSSNTFSFDVSEIDDFVEYAYAVNQLRKRNKDVPRDEQPRLNSLRHKNNRCYNELWFISDDNSAIVLSAGDDAEYVVCLDLRTRKLSSWVAWLNERAEWDSFSMTPHNEVLELLR